MQLLRITSQREQCLLAVYHTDIFTFPEVALRLSCHLAHNLWSIDEKKERSSLVGHCPSDEGLTSTGWTVEEDATRWLHSNGSEQLRVTEGQLYHLKGDREVMILHVHVRVQYVT